MVAQHNWESGRIHLAEYEEADEAMGDAAQSQNPRDRQKYRRLPWPKYQR